MQRLFPHGREAKRQIVEAAAEVDAQEAIIPLDGCDLESLEPALLNRPKLLRVEGTPGAHPSDAS
jgi:hypothetical protein